MSIHVHTCTYCTHVHGIYNMGVNCFWIIDNSQQVLSELHKISTAKHFDSSILYTSILHDSLKLALVSLIQEAYKVRDNFLGVDKYGKGYWSDIPSIQLLLE